MERANTNQAAKEKKIQEDTNLRVTQSRKALAKDHSSKLKLQEDHFKMRRKEIQHETDGFKKMLTEAENRQGVALKALAIAEAELASLEEQVGGITAVMEQVRDEAT